MCHHCGVVSAIDLCNMYLSSAHFVPGVVIGAENTEASEICLGPALAELIL